MKDLFFWITIVRRSDATEYEAFYEDHGVSVIYSLPCHGTVHQKHLDLFGIERTDKTMLFSFVTDHTQKQLLQALTKQMKIDLPDRGVALSIPLSGIGGMRSLEYVTAGQQLAPKTDEPEVQDMNCESEHELIVAIYEKGYTELVMDAAREVGAGGGTVIHAKGTGAGAQKFFGITLAEEKEIVFIVCRQFRKKEIMRAIMQKAGVESRAHALVFSLPVSETAGFRFAEMLEKEV